LCFEGPANARRKKLGCGVFGRGRGFGAVGRVPCAFTAPGLVAAWGPRSPANAKPPWRYRPCLPYPAPVPARHEGRAPCGS